MFDHAAIIAFIDSIWSLLNYENVLFYFLNGICIILIYNVFAGLRRDDGDDDGSVSTGVE